MSERPNRPHRWTWLCEFCFAQVFTSKLPESWRLIWQSAVCSDCHIRVLRDGGFSFVKGGAYAETPDPRSAGNEGSDTPDAAHAEAIDILREIVEDGWIVKNSNATRIEKLLAQHVTPPDCTSRNPSPPGMTLT